MSDDNEDEWVQHMADREEESGGFPGSTGGVGQLRARMLKADAVLLAKAWVEYCTGFSADPLFQMAHKAARRQLSELPPGYDAIQAKQEAVLKQAQDIVEVVRKFLRDEVSLSELERAVAVIPEVR